MSAHLDQIGWFSTCFDRNFVAVSAAHQSRANRRSSIRKSGDFHSKDAGAAVTTSAAATARHWLCLHMSSLVEAPTVRPRPSKFFCPSVSMKEKRNSRFVIIAHAGWHLPYVIIYICACFPPDHKVFFLFPHWVSTSSLLLSFFPLAQKNKLNRDVFLRVFEPPLFFSLSFPTFFCLFRPILSTRSQ